MDVFSKSDTKVYDDLNNIYNFKDGFLLNTIEEIVSSERTNIIDNKRINKIVIVVKNIFFIIYLLFQLQ